MRIPIVAAALLAMALFASPAQAALPYYNPDIGYTIWLPEDWSELPEGHLDSAGAARPFPVRGMLADWQAGYRAPACGCGRSLFVEIQPGRKMLPADISNFNRFIVQCMHRSARDRNLLPGNPRLTLKDATYIQEKRTLRLETEVVHRGETLLSLTYIVYTRKGMLTFVAYLAPEDEQAKSAIDTAVLSLYLDDSIRY